MKTFIHLGANLYKPNKLGYYPLSIAAEEGHSAVVELLVAAGAIYTKEIKKSPLYLAIINGNEDVVKLLLESDCTRQIIYSKNSAEIEFFLKTAISHNYIKITELLLQNFLGIGVNLPQLPTKLNLTNIILIGAISDENFVDNTINYSTAITTTEQFKLVKDSISFKQLTMMAQRCDNIIENMVKNKKTKKKQFDIINQFKIILLETIIEKIAHQVENDIIQYLLPILQNTIKSVIQQKNEIIQKILKKLISRLSIVSLKISAAISIAINTQLNLSKIKMPDDLFKTTTPLINTLRQGSPSFWKKNMYTCKENNLTLPNKEKNANDDCSSSCKLM